MCVYSGRPVTIIFPHMTTLCDDNLCIRFWLFIHFSQSFISFSAVCFSDDHCLSVAWFLFKAFLILDYLFREWMNEWISLVNFFCCCCCCELHLTIIIIIIIIQIINDKLKITKQNLTTCCLTIFCLSPFLFFISMSLSSVNN